MRTNINNVVRIVKPSQGGGGNSEAQTQQGGVQEEPFGEQLTNEGKTLAEALAGKQSQLDKHIKGNQKPREQQMPSDSDKYKPRQAPPGSSQQQQEAAMKNMIQKAKDEAKARGVGSGSMRDTFGEEKVYVNWKNILKSIVERSKKLQTNIARPDIRMLNATRGQDPSNPRAYAHIGRTERATNKLRVCVAIDTSGSIDQKLLNIYISYIFELIKQFKEVELRLILWNEDAYYHEILDTKKSSVSGVMSKIRYIKSVSGGTNLSSVKQRLDQEKVTPDKLNTIVYFTDGYIEDNPVYPTVADKKRNLIFMVNHNGKTDIVDKSGGTVHEVNVGETK